MINKVQVGQQALASSSGLLVPARAGRQGEQIVSNLHGAYTEQVLNDNVFNGAIVGQVTTVGLATTYTGLVLSNPVSSTKNLSILKAGYSFIVAFVAGAHIGLMTGYNASTNVTHTTPVLVRSQYFDGTTAASAGLLDSAATLPTAPTVNMLLGSGLTGAITTVPSLGPTMIDIDGAIVLKPGAYAAFYTSTASGAASGGFSFTWEEIPA